MKTTFCLMMAIIASAALLVSATVWEGVTDVVSIGDLPGGSFSIATNSFPRNTIVDITNLENGKKVRVKVVSGLETTGLLATLSRTAADSIDLRGNSTCRIRMTQPSDDIAFSHYRLGPIAPPPSPAVELDTPAENSVSGADAPAAKESTAANSAVVAGSVPAPRDSTAVNNAVVAGNVPPARDSTAANNVAVAGSAPAPRESTPANNAVVAGNVPPARESTAANSAVVAGSAPVPRDSTAVNNAVVAGSAPVPRDSTVTAGSAAATAGNPPEISIASGTLSMLPAEERPPAETTRYVITPEDSAAYPSLASYIQPAVEKPDAHPTSEFSPFPVPLISSLEPGKWYVQVRVYTNPEYVEDEINRIGTAYPLAIQNVGTDTSPIFRVLLGPLNQGESGAMLQRFKSIGYTDAFVRHN
jgi:hypothetical protein